MTAVDRKIQRYTEATVNLLPFWERKSARRELTDTIYNMLQDYCGNEEPTLRDVRDILNELGSPDSMADQFYTRKRKTASFSGKGIRIFLNALMKAMMIAAVGCLIFGIFVLVTGLSNNMMPVVFGGLLALMVVGIRSVAQPEVRY